MDSLDDAHLYLTDWVLWKSPGVVITPILSTKLYIPPPHPGLVPRSRLVERLNEALHLGHRFTLISAPAGSGKTTLLGEWAAQVRQSVGWLSLSEDDNDLVQFWTYVVAALQQIHPQIGQALIASLQGPQPLPVQALLTPLLNEIATL